MKGKPQLTAADVERGLRAAGFFQKSRTGTAHVQWVTEGRPDLRVTVSAHLEPFSKDLIKLMAGQAGMSVEQFYEICTKDGVKAAKKGKLAWLIQPFN